MSNKSVNVTNNGKGLRGVQTSDGLVYVEPGETAKGLKMAEADIAAADLNDDLDFGKGSVAKTAPEKPAETGDALTDAGNDIPKLRAIAKTEEVELTGLRKAAEIREAIVAARKAKAKEPAPNEDGLDDMEDDMLRASVKTLTGQEPPADATRAELLALARKED